MAGLGQPKTGGRQKGTPNKTTAMVKEALNLAFEDIGGQIAFSLWANANKTEFYKLYAKLLPVELAGSADNPIQVVQKIERQVVRPSDSDS
jgi:hypothetical protein